MNKDAVSSGDSDDLEALFDSIVKANQQSNETKVVVSEPVVESMSVGAGSVAVAAIVSESLPEPAQSMFNKMGQLTRQLHSALHELGFDKALEKAASSIPDARDRLNYIASMTEQAANRALNAVDTAMPLQNKMESEADRLTAEWDKLFNKQLSVDEFKILVGQTREYLKHVPQHTKSTNDQLLEIMMAQDFQDLTGQVIKKIVGMAQEMEQQLYTFLLEFSPQAGKVKQEQDSLTNGPVINPEGRADVVTSQEQVDDLLASLGF